MRFPPTLGPDFKAALAGWAEARIYVAAAYITTLAVVDRLEPQPAFSPVDDGLIPWDGTWYRDLARWGYDSPDLEGGIRFFPLWPLLGRFLGAFGDRPDIALVIAANLLALVAGVLMYRLAMQETDDPEVSRHVVRIFSLFPSAFVLVLSYSEALFLTLALGFVLLSRSRNWAAAAALGFMAGLTRPVGGLLALPALVRVLSSDRSPGDRDTADHSPGGRSSSCRDRSSLLAWLAVASAPLGTLTFLAWAERAQGGWRVPIDAQEELRGVLREPATRIIAAFVDGFKGDSGELLHGTAAVVLLFLGVVTVLKLSTDLWVYAVPSTLLLFAAENLNSMERYALAVFPLVLAAGIVSHAPLLRRWLPTASGVALTLFTILALNGVYVP